MTSNTLTPERKAELEKICRGMESVSHSFYFEATRIGNHAFIEFCGLMNEYIKICRMNMENGIDFTQANTHTGQPMIFAPYHAEYLLEKLDCIYGPSLASLVKKNLFPIDPI